MNRYIVLLASLFMVYSSPSVAQESNVRVINQSANGLAYPSSSYIGPGTLSKTAQQGAGYQPANNPGLPKVNHGGYFGTPGDNLYSGRPDLSRPPQPIKSQRQMRVIYRQPLQEQPKSNTYVPDPNIPMSYSDYKADPTVSPESQVTPLGNKLNNSAPVSK